jgi:hypothetical protein
MESEKWKVKSKKWGGCANIVTLMSKGLQGCKPRTDTGF